MFNVAVNSFFATALSSIPHTGLNRPGLRPRSPTNPVEGLWYEEVGGKQGPSALTTLIYS